MENKTAVEWLEGFFYSESKELGFDKWVIPGYQMERIIDYAKKMEKEQLEKAYQKGFDDATSQAIKETHKYQ